MTTLASTLTRQSHQRSALLHRMKSLKLALMRVARKTTFMHNLRRILLPLMTTLASTLVQRSKSHRRSVPDSRIKRVMVVLTTAAIARRPSSLRRQWRLVQSKRSPLVTTLLSIPALWNIHLPPLAQDIQMKADQRMVLTPPVLRTRASVHSLLRLHLFPSPLKTTSASGPKRIKLQPSALDSQITMSLMVVPSIHRT